jgi:hypothetical protein
MNPVYIYSLVDPRDKRVRYIGKTVNITKRYENHLHQMQGFNPHKENWIKKLTTINLKPELQIIEICNEKNWKDREKYWIAYYREKHNDLTNILDGGEGVSSREWREICAVKVAKRHGIPIKKCFVCGAKTISSVDICHNCLYKIDTDFKKSEWYQFLMKDIAKEKQYDKLHSFMQKKSHIRGVKVEINMQRTCVCGKPIANNMRLCKNCYLKYGSDSSEWPEWVKFMVNDIKREVRYEERHKDNIFIDEYFVSPEARRNLTKAKRNPEMDFEDFIWDNV